MSVYVYPPKSITSKYEVGDNTAVQSYDLTYLVQFSEAFISSPLDAFEAIGIPIGTEFVFNAYTDPYSFLKGWDANCNGEKEDTLWEVTLHFEAYNRAANQPNPLANAPMLYVNGEPYDTFTGVDAMGNAVLNSAGMPFDPSIPSKNTRINVRIERNEASFTLSEISYYQNTVNQAPWLGFDMWTVLLTHVEPQIMYAPEVGYFVRMTYEFLVETAPSPNDCQPGWMPCVADMGLQQLGDSGNLENILDENNNPITAAVLLDGEGHQLEDPTPTDAVYIQFQTYNQLDFNSFAFDFSAYNGVISV
jgi:hypothetical protein